MPGHCETEQVWKSFIRACGKSGDDCGGFAGRRRCWGVSILSGAHNTLCPRIVSLLRDQGLSDTLVVLGGIVPQEDIPKLKEQGVAEVFLPGTSTQDIAEFIRANVKPRD